MLTICFYFKYSFLKNKKRFVTSLSASFSALFLKKMTSLVIFIHWPSTKPYCLVAVTFWDIWQSVYCNFMCSSLWHKFWNLPWLSYQAVLLQKKQDQNVNILRTKITFQMKEKTLFIFLKGLLLKQIKQTFLEGERIRL